MDKSKLIGYILLAHFTLLFINRISENYAHNLFWISHLALLLAAIGFIFYSNLLISGALVLVLVVHAFWIVDFINLIVYTISPFEYTSYWLDLNLYEKFLTTHHLYLAPLLLTWVWLKKKIHDKGWIVAAIVYASAVLTSLLFLPPYANVNCAHAICYVGLNIIPGLEFLLNYPSGLQSMILVVFMGTGFFLVNYFLTRIIRKYPRKSKRSRIRYTK